MNVEVRDGHLHRVEFVWYGNPGVGSINSRQEIHRFGAVCRACGKRKLAKIGNTAKAKGYKAEIAALLASAVEGIPHPMMPREVALRILVYWPRAYGPKSGSCLDGLPLGDVDAVDKLTLDCFKLAGVLHDDGQCMDLAVRKKLDRDCPRVAVALERIDADVEPML